MTFSSKMMSSSNALKATSRALIGSAFLMATSAIGPGFITQTTVFTAQLTTSFGFVILCSIVLDIIVQLNIWRIVSVSGLRAQDLANAYLPGSGYVLSLLVITGGLAFNIGNIAGAGLGLQVLTGMEIWMGVLISAVIAIAIFLYKEAGRTLDLFTKLLGLAMIILMLYVAISSAPPFGAVVLHTFFPERIDTTAIIVLVGGTVGGYISFAGVHRLLDAGIKGEQNLTLVSQSSVKAILLASAMRVLLFLAALGVVVEGGVLDPANPPASVFQLAAGNIGYRIFGVVLWCASITSVVGSAYTSVSFLRTFHLSLEKGNKLIIVLFIVSSTIIYLLIGRPIKVLVIVGALNAFILPFALAIILQASLQKKLMGSYHHPVWLRVSGWIVVVALTVMSFKTIFNDLAKLWQ